MLNCSSHCELWIAQALHTAATHQDRNFTDIAFCLTVFDEICVPEGLFVGSCVPGGGKSFRCLSSGCIGLHDGCLPLDVFLNVIEILH